VTVSIVAWQFTYFSKPGARRNQTDYPLLTALLLLDLTMSAGRSKAATCGHSKAASVCVFIPVPFHRFKSRPERLASGASHPVEKPFELDGGC
jgi:hypothetical protein